MTWCGPFTSDYKMSRQLSNITELLRRPKWRNHPVSLSVTIAPCPTGNRESLPENECADAFIADWEFHGLSVPQAASRLCAFRVADPTRLLFECTGTKKKAFIPVLNELLDWLSMHSEVMWVEPRYPVQAQLRWAKQLTYTQLPDAATVVVPPRLSFPLSGQTEIVGCADTGIDTDLSFFYDPNYPLPPYNYVNLNHRKVVTYVTVNADGGDSNGGHGTFCVSEAPLQSPPRRSAHAFVSTFADRRRVHRFHGKPLAVERPGSERQNRLR